MRQDPIELSLEKSAADRRGRVRRSKKLFHTPRHLGDDTPASQALAPSQVTAPQVTAPQVIDEAFASLIASQLEALDQQREQLARLLDGVDATL